VASAIIARRLRRHVLDAPLVASLAERWRCAEMYVRDGYAVLFADSFRARGMREICTIKHGERTVTAAKRRLDALGALGYLASRADIARDRIAVVGWSHGGSAALLAVNARDTAVAAFFARPGAPPFFRAAVAFYPGCGAAQGRRRLSTSAPTHPHRPERRLTPARRARNSAARWPRAARTCS
jgi:dienelactone hydrolase